jgi:hypothetical protein
MLRRSESCKFSCSLRSSIADDQETKTLSNKRSTGGCSCSNTVKNVVKSLRYLTRQVGGQVKLLFLVSATILGLQLHRHVDTHSVAASSHSSRCERESEREATSRSRAGRSRRASGHTDATTVVSESQSQRTVGTTTSPPAAVGINAALLAARQLLNNPPLSGASPSAAEQ